MFNRDFFSYRLALSKKAHHFLRAIEYLRDNSDV